jgi:hypothetical protein
MNFTDEALKSLARRLGEHYPDNPQGFREALEASLLPLVRCALRNRTGVPAVVRWVERNLPEQNRPADLAWAAPVMARKLCATLLSGYQQRHAFARPARETVAEAV